MSVSPEGSDGPGGRDSSVHYSRLRPHRATNRPARRSPRWSTFWVMWASQARTRRRPGPRGRWRSGRYGVRGTPDRLTAPGRHRRAAGRGRGRDVVEPLAVYVHRLGDGVRTPVLRVARSGASHPPCVLPERRPVVERCHGAQEANLVALVLALKPPHRMAGMAFSLAPTGGRSRRSTAPSTPHRSSAGWSGRRRAHHYRSASVPCDPADGPRARCATRQR